MMRSCAIEKTRDVWAKADSCADREEEEVEAEEEAEPAKGRPPPLPLPLLLSPSPCMPTSFVVGAHPPCPKQQLHLPCRPQPARHPARATMRTSRHAVSSRYAREKAREMERVA